MLRFLIDSEDFKHMRDVVENDCKCKARFNNYGETISTCYGCSRGTVINRHKDYEDIREKLKKRYT